jgi:hypothetical protein
MTNDYFLVKNFFNYEKIIPPPKNLPKNLITVYVTDSDKNAETAKKLGWEITKVLNEYTNITDPFEKRKLVAFINSYPLKVVPELENPRYIFICDSNINDLWFNYRDFVEKCSDDYVLFVTSGYYTGNRDNIESECCVSCTVSRWFYNHEGIRKSTEKYKKILNDNNIDYNNLSVVSAKYIGWNVTHPDYKYLSDFLYKEYSENLQGNIILTYMSGIFNKKIYNFYTNDYTGASLNGHNYES